MSRKQRRESKKKQAQNEQYKASIVDCSQTFVLQMDIPRRVLIDLQAYSRDLISDTESTDFKNQLVGEVENGDELAVDENDPKIIEIAEKVKTLAVSYIHEYQKRVPAFNINFTAGGLDVANDSIWLNRFKKGDYNPFHDHTTSSRIGLSWFLYIKVPEDMNNHNSANALGSQKWHNGCTSLHYGYSYHDPVSCMESLVIPPKMTLNPVEGQLYMFPKWLKHQVYPHSCDGERISMAGNVSVHWKPCKMEYK
jgi:hypothetical protein